MFLDGERRTAGIAGGEGEGELEAVVAGIGVEKAERRSGEKRRGVKQNQIDLRNGETEKRRERRVGNRGIPRARQQPRGGLGVRIPAGKYGVREEGADARGGQRGVVAEPAEQRGRVERKAEPFFEEGEQFPVLTEKPDRVEHLVKIGARSVPGPAGRGRRGGPCRQCRVERSGGSGGRGRRSAAWRRRGWRGGWIGRCGRRSRPSRLRRAERAGQG